MRKTPLVLALLIIWFSVLHITSSSIFAADISVIDGRYEGEKYVSITGKIARGDLEKVKHASAQAINATERNLTLHINTGGGDLLEAMKIGRFARKLLATTYSYGKAIVPPGHWLIKSEKEFQQAPFNLHVLPKGVPLTEKDIVRCYSAGVFILYGGVNRYVSDNNDFRNGKESIIVIGIHRPKFDASYFSELSPEKADKQYKALQEEAREYLIEMDAPQSLIDQMFDTASDKVQLIESDKFRKEYLASKAPFFDEWLIAKCGSSGQKAALDEKEYGEYMMMSSDLLFEVSSNRLLKNQSDFKNPLPEGITPERARYIVGKLDDHNSQVSGCKRFAVRKFQEEWAVNAK
jgi:hypothetical protein